MNDLVLPAELRPADGRFGSGPSKVRGPALEALAAAGPTYLGTSHRRQGVRSVVRRIRDGLTALFSLPDGYEVLLGNGGATAFWDAATFGLIEDRSLHYVFGEFSGKFAGVVAAAPHLDDPVSITSEFGTHPEPVGIPADVDTVALTGNETSTGVAMAVERPAGAALVLVDATSSAGAVPVDARAFDTYYFSPQKAFGADGGLWVALCSPGAVARVEDLGARRWAPPFLDLRLALADSRKEQTYNTPPLATLFLLADQIDWLLERGGLDWAAEHGRRAAGVVYGWAERSLFLNPFVADPGQRSTTVATIDLDAAVPAADLTGILRANGIVDLEGYRKLGRNQIRVGMFPAVEIADLERLTAAVDWIVERMVS
jgi:phosphoserine aminotransferase